MTSYFRELALCDDAICEPEVVTITLVQLKGQLFTISNVFVGRKVSLLFSTSGVKGQVWVSLLVESVPKSTLSQTHM